jgi:exonuclease III
LDIDIAALSENRLGGEGSLKEENYTFFWKGYHPEKKKSLHEVGFAVKNSIASKLNQVPYGISERLFSLRIRILKQEHITLICAYAPTLDANFEANVAFYQELERALRSTPNGDRIILLGDFNARVVRDYDIWPGVIGRHGLGNMNDNGELLLSLCAEHDLCITNTMFRQHNKFKGT